MKLNLAAVTKVLSILLGINGLFMLLCLPTSYYYDENTLAILLPAIASIGLGGLGYLISIRKSDAEINRRDGYMVVTLGWIIMSVSGAFPYILSGYIPDFTGAFFETMSGYTTTGATVLTDIESVDKGILLWRSLTQWIGGMGFIVLTVAILPFFGIGGMQLFMAEAPGITTDKVKPKIRDTAIRLWLIYLVLTIVEMLLLLIAGMGFYDALNHALTTMSTGGFSTRQDSVAYFTSPAIQYIIIAFMLLAGTNFTVIYFSLKGNFKKVFGNEEFKYYYLIIFSFAILVGSIIVSQTPNEIEKAFRDSLFQVASVISTTGYITADYTLWTPFITILFFLMMFLGGSAGSTAGGIKIVRHILLIKNSFLELKRQLHPSAVIPVRLNQKAVAGEITFRILAFIMIYLISYTLGVFAISFTDIDFETALGAVASCLGNVGPGLGNVGPVYSYAEITTFGKWLLSFIMMLGRLELFTVFIVFTPYFWKK
ncbi:MAG TPA: TrkH family potassium uptake protein [Cyclobacteriaceae bacterium]|nr:TrkH family potassium uptake protein [Cyclobacteriaceae bacterium]